MFFSCSNVYRIILLNYAPTSRKVSEMTIAVETSKTPPILSTIIMNTHEAAPLYCRNRIRISLLKLFVTKAVSFIFISSTYIRHTSVWKERYLQQLLLSRVFYMRHNYVTSEALFEKQETLCHM